MTDAFKYLCLLMDMDTPRISVHEASMWPDDGFERFLAQGFLQQAENAEYVTCPDCHDHQEEVVCREYPGGIVRWFIACPDCGRVQLEPDEIKQWGINCGAVAQAIASSLSLAGKCMDIGSGRVWRLGRWKLPDGVRDVLFAVGLSSQDGSSLRRAITSAHKPIVLVPRQVPPDEFWVGKTPPLILLHDAAEIVDDQIVLDPHYVLDVVRQDELEPVTTEALSQEQLMLMIRKMIRTERRVELTDEILLAAHQSCGSVRKAAQLLTDQLKQTVSKDKVQRAVDRAGGLASVAADRNSESVIRSRSRDRRDTTPDRAD